MDVGMLRVITCGFLAGNKTPKTKMAGFFLLGFFNESFFFCCLVSVFLLFSLAVLFCLFFCVCVLGGVKGRRKIVVSLVCVYLAGFEN